MACVGYGLNKSQSYAGLAWSDARYGSAEIFTPVVLKARTFAANAEWLIIDSRDKTKNPAIIIKEKGNERKYSIPVKAHIAIDEGDTLKAGTIVAKIPRIQGSSGEITGGLPRVTE